jgi:NADH:ubiquinone oxidoreductase subunit F (NADH-binding)
MKPEGARELTFMPRLIARKLRDAHRPDVDSFYHLPAGVGGKSCQGTACFVARHLKPTTWERTRSNEQRVYCLGKCYMGPSTASDNVRPHFDVDCTNPVILERLVHGPARQIDQYVTGKGYRALEKTLRQSREEILRTIEASGLRGRGGAAFSTGKKWRLVAEQSRTEKYVIANADEGDSGSYIDRFILEDDPHCLIEGMCIASHVIGAKKGMIYLRAEYPAAKAILDHALDEARQAGFLKPGKDGYEFDIEIVVGKGSYLCGEETALLNSIQGQRPVAMARPPYAADQGLFGQPTLINNIETLAAIPWIVRNGGSSYAAQGFSKSRGTKVVSLNSLFRRPGLYEVEFGVPVRRIVEVLGGGLQSGVLKGVMIGGPLAGVIPPHLLDTLFGFEELRAIKASVGHGGIVAFDERTSIAELIHYIFSFGAYESCGKCTPCRIGSREIEELFSEILRHGTAAPMKAHFLEEITDALKLTSLCGHGTGLAEFMESVAYHYKGELSACFR